MPLSIEISDRGVGLLCLAILIALGLVTAVMGYFATQLRMDAGGHLQSSLTGLLDNGFQFADVFGQGLFRRRLCVLVECP